MDSEKIKGDEPISWDQCFIKIAHTIAMRSRDPNTKNGAVVVNENKIVVGLGYNGFPRGVDDTKLPWEREGEFCDTKYAYVVHAEENAIYNANAKTDGCKLYCTLFPCNECAKTIIQNGIKEVIYESDKYRDDKIWVASRKLFDLAGVKYRQVTQNLTEYVERENLKIRIKKISQEAIVPTFAYRDDAGMDLYSTEEVEILPGSRAKIPTGLAFEIPKNFVGLIWDRTSVSIKKGLKIAGGVVDSGYRGELFVGMVNVSKEPVEIAKGEKVAQMVIQRFEQPEIEIAEELNESERGKNTLGSSDFKQIDPIEDLGLDYLPEEEPAEAGNDLILEKENIVVKEEGGDEKSRW